MDNEWYAKAKAKLEAEVKRGGTIPYEQLRAIGMIDENGEVTGQVHRWYSDFAVVEVKRHPSTGEIESVRGFKPIFGIPGGDIVELSLETLLQKLQGGKQIITAYFDERLELWREGPPVKLSPDGKITAVNGTGDELEKLPEFKQSMSLQ